jgi:hypothetical protein
MATRGRRLQPWSSLSAGYELHDEAERQQGSWTCPKVRSRIGTGQ